MTASGAELQRRALVMRRIRVILAVLVPVEMFLYIPPPHMVSPLRPLPASLGVAGALLAVTALSALVHRRVRDAARLTDWASVELVADVAICLGVLQLFAFDQLSSIWTVLVIVVLEGAFRASLRGAVAVGAGGYAVYAGIQVYAAHAFPLTAPLDLGSIVFRALVVGTVAVVAGQLAAQLEAAVERHRRSEIALAEQYADLRLIGRVSRAIAAGPEARLDVCQAVAELTDAAVVLLYEPAGAELRGTAAAGCPLETLPILTMDDEVSGTVEAFQTGRRVHRAVARVPRAVASAANFPAATATSTTFVPVLQDGRAIGVLVLAFTTHLAEVPARVLAALDVLAEEAAVAIARADTSVRLAEQARRDPLTGLVNRRGLHEALEVQLAQADSTSAPLSLVMLDLDGLKAFNDSRGHQAGDALLTAVAAAWRSRLRPGDVLARYGGDEFVVLLPGCTAADALQLAASLLVDLPPGGRASAGVAEWDGAENHAGLIARADAALYAGKRSGGGRAVESAGGTVVPLPRPAGPAAHVTDHQGLAKVTGG